MYVFPGLWFVFLLCLRCSHWFKMLQFCMITQHPHRVEPEGEDGENEESCMKQFAGKVSGLGVT